MNPLLLQWYPMGSIQNQDHWIRYRSSCGNAVDVGSRHLDDANHTIRKRMLCCSYVQVKCYSLGPVRLVPISMDPRFMDLLMFGTSLTTRLHALSTGGLIILTFHPRDDR